GRKAKQPRSKCPNAVLPLLAPEKSARNWPAISTGRRLLVALPSPSSTTTSANGRSASTQFPSSACPNVWWKVGAKNSMKLQSPCPVPPQNALKNSINSFKRPISKFTHSNGPCLRGPRLKTCILPLPERCHVAISNHSRPIRYRGPTREPLARLSNPIRFFCPGRNAAHVPADFPLGHRRQGV